LLVAPSILSADFSRLGEEMVALEEAGADWVHVDVMDGHFVPPITFGATLVKHCRRYVKLPFDVHLMIENPERSIDAFRDAGATTLSVHVEASHGPAAIAIAWSRLSLGVPSVSDDCAAAVDWSPSAGRLDIVVAPGVGCSISVTPARVASAQG
jgi:pentose-5-phosphate-3-epimerase